MSVLNKALLREVHIPKRETGARESTGIILSISSSPSTPSLFPVSLALLFSCHASRFDPPSNVAFEPDPSGEPVVRRTVTKAGPNHGRPISFCAKPKDTGCGFICMLPLCDCGRSAEVAYKKNGEAYYR